MKNSKGITLIALVITIIVLIILAGVAINLTLGENGIFRRAEDAKLKYEIAQAEEELDIKIAELQVEKQGSATLQDVVDMLKAEDGMDYIVSLEEIASITGVEEIGDVDEIYVVYKIYQFRVDNRLETEFISIVENYTADVAISSTLKSYDGKNDDEKYLATMEIKVESEGQVESIEIETVDGKVTETPTSLPYTKEIQVEIGQKYIVKVTLPDGKYKRYVIEEKAEETIKTAQELVAFRDKVNSGFTYEGKTVIIAADNIDLSSVCGENVNGKEVSWEPIGNTTTPFKGNLQGNDTTISNIYINTTNTYQGLFGYIENGTIKNLTINGEIKNSNQHTGSVAGNIKNTIIENCVNFVNIYVDKTSKYAQVGGFVGYARSNSIIRQCKNYGTIISKYAYIGGILGKADSCTIEECINYSIVDGQTTNAYAVGGIAGHSSASTINSCVNKGSVSGDRDAVGGILGCSWVNLKATTYINNCYNTGTITASSTSGYAGGISGNFSEILVIKNCYNIGTISGKNRDSIVYNMNGTITSKNCYYLSTGVASSYGTSKTDTQLQGLASTLGNAFTNDVKIKVINEETGLEEEVWSNGGYPILKWQIGE